MTDDLIKRLDDRGRDQSRDAWDPVGKLCAEAAAALAEARDEIARLREALEFYATEEDWWDMKSDEHASYCDRNIGTKIGDDYGEVARAALAPPAAPNGGDTHG